MLLLLLLLLLVLVELVGLEESVHVVAEIVAVVGRPRLRVDALLLAAMVRVAQVVFA